MLLQFTSLITLLASNYLVPAQGARLPLQVKEPPRQEILAAQTSKGPIKNPKMLGVKMTATAAIVLDKESGKVLFAKNVHQKLPQASLTKIMTAVTVMDNSPQPDDIVTVGKGPAYVQPQGAHMRLASGEKISVYNLLRGLLMSSANDAGVALGEYIAGSETKFVDLMNQKARILGLKDSHFKNTHGIDAEGHYSSAYDLAEITRYALEKKVFREIINTPTIGFTTNIRDRFLKNSNKLLQSSYLNIIGGKTGFTDNAGYCLIEVASDKKGHEIITVVMNSKNEWQESKGLINWTFRAYQWK